MISLLALHGLRHLRQALIGFLQCGRDDIHLRSVHLQEELKQDQPGEEPQHEQVHIKLLTGFDRFPAEHLAQEEEQTDPPTEEQEDEH